MRRVPVLVWFLVPSLIIAIVGVWFFSRSGGEMQQGEEHTALPEAVSRMVEGTVDYEIVGRDHIAEGTTGSGYNSNPPTSGSHWPIPAGTGIYEEQLADERLIHNLEHGHIWISYKSDVPEEVINRLKEIVEDDDWKVVLVPRDENETPIALAAWGRLLVMDEPDYTKIEDFIRIYRNRGPEKTAN